MLYCYCDIPICKLCISVEGDVTRPMPNKTMATSPSS